MSTAAIVIIIINVLLAKIFSVGTTPIMVWWERRVAGFMQDRTGPNRADIGGIRLGGLIQAIADMLKLVFKEDFTPAHIKYKFLYTIAPAIVFLCSFMTMAVIPFADNLVIDGESFMMQAIPTTLGIMWFLAFAGLSVFGIILGGYSSQNKYGLLGGIRASAQVISYEAAMALSVISILLTYGSINLNDMVQAQGDTFWGIIPSWGLFMQPLAALIFIVTAFAETNRTPFDIAEGESEIVAGYHTEYSAMRFGLFQVGEYAAMSASSAIIVTLFLGGYQIPWMDTQSIQSNINYVMIAIIILLPLKAFFFAKWMNKNYNWLDKNDKRQKEKNILIRGFWATAIIIAAVLALFVVTGLGTNGVNIATAVIQVAVFVAKFLFMSFVFIWVRWTLLRFRYDQLQMLGWKVLIPLSILNIVITAIIVVATGS
ncbi:complex I subunit 1/NuoH family protein [Halarcobacter anaerophilus]|jgi:NADH-quinone oxidoreductase subunit H|uniref:NADH-quinone oxidoreductase subunit H n=1 Tax=Halarcobacter anaerophilus TaxID=877500 RepID=A0A4Q0Y0E3_9BACT|nr:complex I subunit 1 family protein [Halarcobacter anaerophilus]QDF29982.1 NADH:quinone oxidoreductase I, membrane subunit H [Halarcobacter anaerophilus]RXJ63033.1 NADH-quinone oxidoreductase subunit H [Halarcobacter anaerophilus]